MRRREFMLVVGAAATWPLVVLAQQSSRVYRVGFLWDSPSVWPDALEGFRQAMRELGWAEGQNLAIVYRWAEGRFERLPELAEDLVSVGVDIIVAPTSIYAGAAKRATSTIPVVFVSHADPIGSGHVASLARPGGNLTGTSLLMTETNAKGLELLKEAVPGVSKVAVVYDPATPSHAPGLEAAKDTASKLALEIIAVPMPSSTDLASTFAEIKKQGASAVLVMSTPLFFGAARPLADLAIEHKLPMLFGPREHAVQGGLMSYGPDRIELYRRAATYVDKILKGAKPSDLPVAQPTKFELVLNLRTAKAIGLDIPAGFILRADEVIE
jgi:putative tryptophan/tyrosine transport system substrate-binding protein